MIGSRRRAGLVGLVVLLASTGGCPRGEGSPTSTTPVEAPSSVVETPTEAETAEREPEAPEPEASEPEAPATPAELVIRPEDLCAEGIDERHRPSAPCLLADRSRILTPRIEFPPDHEDVKPASLPMIDQLAELLLRYPSLELRIEGHKNATPRDGQYARKITQRRADAVLHELVERGVERTRLQSVGFEGERPLVPPRDREANLVNRRIELHVIASAPG